MLVSNAVNVHHRPCSPVDTGDYTGRAFCEGDQHIVTRTSQVFLKLYFLPQGGGSAQLQVALDSPCSALHQNVERRIRGPIMAKDQAGWPAIPLLGSFEIVMPNQMRRDHLDLNRRKEPTRT